MVARVLGFEGELVFDASKPDGTPRKLMDVAKLHGLGWRHRTELEQGIAKTWELVRSQLV
jgi:GDP-L-fucose synthase